MKGYDKLIYRYDPTGYGDWGSPYYFAQEFHQKHEGYSGDRQKTVYTLTDFYMLDHNGEPARLYVPEGMSAEESGLDIKPVNLEAEKVAECEAWSVV